MATHNSKPAAELRIGTVKATVWENEVGGITHHNVTFSTDLPRGGQWKTTQSFRFVNLLSVAKLADQAHTLMPSARPRRPRRLAITKPAKRRTFRRRVNARRLFSWTPVPARGRHALSETITAQDPSADSAMGCVAKGRHSAI